MRMFVVSRRGGSRDREPRLRLTFIEISVIEVHPASSVCQMRLSAMALAAYGLSC